MNVQGFRRAAGPVAAIVIVVLVALAVVVTNPRHRSFYAIDRLGWPASSSGTRASSLPAAVAPIDTSARRVHVPTVGADGVLRIPVVDRLPPRLPVDGVPPGWDVKEFAGRAVVSLVRSDEHVALRLEAENSSFALFRDVIVDPHATPLLSWSWKVSRLPAGGDVRERGRDDEAAQLYVVFPRWPSPLSNSEVIGYVWDSTAPVGTQTINARADNVRIIVVDSGAAHLGTWQRYQRNVVDDYVALFGRQPTRVGKVAVMIDANDTASLAESFVSDIAFGPRSGQIGGKTPTSMLR